MNRDRIICAGEGGCGAVVAVDQQELHVEWHAYVYSLELRLDALKKALGGSFVSAPAATSVAFVPYLGKPPTKAPFSVAEIMPEQP